MLLNEISCNNVKGGSNKTEPVMKRTVTHENGWTI